MDFGELERKVVVFRDARGWAKYHTPKNLAISAVVELVELLEHFQWETDGEILELAENPTKREAIADEIADVIIYITLLAHELGNYLFFCFTSRGTNTNPTNKAGPQMSFDFVFSLRAHGEVITLNTGLFHLHVMLFPPLWHSKVMYCSHSPQYPPYRTTLKVVALSSTSHLVIVLFQ